MSVERAIRKCLRQKHSKDLVVEECKDGPTTYGSHLRMDMWVMPRSWSKPMCTAYEIKVSRSDFLRDDKWPGYLDLCNYFYFVCPAGLIEPEELPEGVGLMWLSKTGTRLYTKRKAAPRDVTIPESLWRYVLMCRATIDGSEYLRQGGLSEREWWEQWLEQKEIDREFGSRVGGEIRRRFKEEVHKVRSRNESLQDAIEQYDQLHKLLIEVTGTKFSLDDPPASWALRRNIESLGEIIPRHLRNQIDNLSKSLANVVAEVERLEGEQRGGGL